jgi:hypothetical protein
MKTTIRVATTLAAIGAAALCVFEFTLALEGAGSLRSLQPVKVGFVVGVVPAYFTALWLAAWATHRARKLAQGRLRAVALAIITVAASVGTYVAPLIPSALLAAACLNQSWCPEAANPVLWSYLQLITSLPRTPLVVGLAVVLVAARIPKRLAAANEA